MGLAHYRAGNYQTAIDVSLNSLEFVQEELDLPAHDCGNLAILAMSHFQLDNKNEANKYRDKLAETMKLDPFKEHEECLGHVKEVNALFGSGHNKVDSIKPENPNDKDIE